MQGIGEVDAAETALAEPRAHLWERETLRRNAEVVALHDDDLGIRQGRGRAIEDWQLIAVRVELEEVRPGQLARRDLAVQRHHRHLDAASPGGGRRLSAERVVAGLEKYLACPFSGGREDVLGVRVPRAILAQGRFVDRLSLDEQILTTGKVAHQVIGPPAVRRANVDDRAKTMVACPKGPEEPVHRGTGGGAARADKPQSEPAQRALDQLPAEAHSRVKGICVGAAAVVQTHASLAGMKSIAPVLRDMPLEAADDDAVSC